MECSLPHQRNHVSVTDLNLNLLMVYTCCKSKVFRLCVFEITYPEFRTKFPILICSSATKIFCIKSTLLSVRRPPDNSF